MQGNRGRFVLSLILLATTLGAGAQARPPQTSSNPARPGAAYRTLDAKLAQFEFPELRKAVATLPPSVQRDYYAGMLANRNGHPAESISLLLHSLSWVKETDPRRAATALEALADDYVKTFRYADAVRAYEELFQHYAAQLDAAQKRDDGDDLSALRLLADAPPQKIEQAAVALPTRRNDALDTIDTELTVDGVTQSWLIDTGANFSTVSESFARRLGLKLSASEGQTQGITGAENPLHTAILPELHLGAATLHNVVLIVLPDQSLNVPSGPKSYYQIQAILGYPVLRALDRFTLTRDGRFLAGPGSPVSDSGAALYMYKLMPMLECKVEGRMLVFGYDSGANRSAFSDRYYREFPRQFQGLRKRPYSLGGAGGIRNLQVFYLPEAELGIGAATAILHNVPVLPAIGTTLSSYYGNLGRDLTDAYDRFTVDFVNMRLSLGTPVGSKVR